MIFLDFKRHFADFEVFGIRDILKWNPKFDPRRLVEWQEKKYICKVINGWYIFNEPIEQDLLYLISNRIYGPSYISLESALSYHRLIPEGVFSITAVTTLKTQKFETPVGTFSYRHIKPQLMFGYKLLQTHNYPSKIAEPEKALLDLFYLNAHLNSEEDILSLRLNSPELDLRLDRKRIDEYLKLINNKQLEKRVRLFMNTVMNDAER